MSERQDRAVRNGHKQRSGNQKWNRKPRTNVHATRFARFIPGKKKADTPNEGTGHEAYGAKRRSFDREWARKFD